MDDAQILTSPDPRDSMTNTEHKFIRGGQWRSVAFPILRWALGLLLLTAAALKFQGSAPQALSQNTLLLSPRLQFTTVVTETLLGLWLLSGLYANWSRRAAIGFFGLLGAVSLSLGLQGQSSCNCFGRIHVNPWATFGLDVAVVLALAVCRPRRNPGEAIRWRGFVWTLAGTALILGLAGGWLMLAGGSPAAALARLRGETITVEPALTDLGEGQRGERRVFQVNVTNNSKHMVRVIGGTSNCSCVSTDSLPVELGPGESRSIDIRTVFKGTAGYFQNRFVLYTEDDRLRAQVIRFEGRVIEPSQP